VFFFGAFYGKACRWMQRWQHRAMNAVLAQGRRSPVRGAEAAQEDRSHETERCDTWR
jgi:hypothetical protein